jgi:hypothetical protein
MRGRLPVDSFSSAMRRLSRPIICHSSKVDVCFGSRVDGAMARAFWRFYGIGRVR